MSLFANQTEKQKDMKESGFIRSILCALFLSTSKRCELPPPLPPSCFTSPPLPFKGIEARWLVAAGEKSDHKNMAPASKTSSVMHLRSKSLSKGLFIRLVSPFDPYFLYYIFILSFILALYILRLLRKCFNGQKYQYQS